MDVQHRSVKVTLDRVKPETDPSLFSKRVLTLQAPDWAVKIGRSTSSGTGPRQAVDNAWYNSRVVSRDHAELTADPLTGEVLIRDAGSMHGTHVLGRRLKRGVTERLYNGDTIVFGAEVARGDDMFYPVEVVASYTWSDESSGAHAVASSSRNSNSTRNYFTIDYSDDELDGYESEGSLESAAEARANVINNFSVPESDVSDDIVSIISDDAPPSDVESPTSSPVEPINHGKRATENKENGPPRQGAGRMSYSPYPVDQSSPALGDYVADDDIPDEDSYYEDSSVFDGEDEIQADVGDEPELLPESSAPPPPRDPNLPGGSSSQPIFLSPSPPLGRPARDPSPSDAAMVKPAGRPLSPPAIRQTLPPIQPAPAVPSLSSYQYTSSYLQPVAPQPYPVPKSSSAWAGHNSVLYESFQDSIVQDTYFAYNPQGSSSGVADYVPYEAASAEFLPEFDDTEVHRCGDDLGASSSEPPVLPTNASNATGQKRKADAISDDHVVVEDSAKERAQTPPDATMSATSDPLDIQPIVVTETIESINSPSTGPARKKARKSKHDTGSRKNTKHSSFTRYAATALAGAAIGAVGTILGLVALPKDFFV